jgi:putative endonuclease
MASAGVPHCPKEKAWEPKRAGQIKRWLRVKKIALIVAMNPTWRDLSEEWGRPVEMHRKNA